MLKCLWYLVWPSPKVIYGWLWKIMWLKLHVNETNPLFVAVKSVDGQKILAEKSQIPFTQVVFVNVLFCLQLKPLSMHNLTYYFYSQKVPNTVWYFLFSYDQLTGLSTKREQTSGNDLPQLPTTHTETGME